ncbi:MAG: AAC(3) family N-acetyltransferase [Acidimicrobiales bacterium]
MDERPEPHELRQGPFTVTSLTHDLRALGLDAGATVLVHSSLSALGYVVGGARAVVMALDAVLGPRGTLVVPTHSAELSDPSHWINPPIPDAWWAVVRESMPAYDPELTATRKMGAVTDVVRHLPGFVRSAHPRVSFGAVGPHAEFITGAHELRNGFDEHSPLARLYDLEASILLLGVGHHNNTSLHLGEGRAPARRRVITQGAPMMVEGQRRWVTYESLDYDDNDFEQVGAAIAAAGLERSGRVGASLSRYMDVVPVVDFAVTWFTQHRTWPRSWPQERG